MPKHDFYMVSQAQKVIGAKLAFWDAVRDLEISLGQDIDDSTAFEGMESGEEILDYMLEMRKKYPDTINTEYSA